MTESLYVYPANNMPATMLLLRWTDGVHVWGAQYCILWREVDCARDPRFIWDQAIDKLYRMIGRAS